jgi:FkbM family methyltransferase
MLLFDIGANRGDATLAGLQKGYKVIALEPAPKVFKELVINFIYNPQVVPLKIAVSNANNKKILFYEAEEDGLSTLNKEWLTNVSLPYAGKRFREIMATTCTIDYLVERYGVPDLIKIDVEGGEWNVFRGMTKKYNKLCFEWTLELMEEHLDQLGYLRDLGYTEFAPQFIVNHLDEPEEYFSLENPKKAFYDWYAVKSLSWVEGDWKMANLRPTADVGMMWVK